MTELRVCICTYNRADLLEQALISLTEARMPEDGTWRLLLIDNNSTDHTARIAGGYDKRLPLRHVKETHQGLSHARNRACAEFEGDLLLFMDDDVRVGRDWLAEFQAAMAAYPEAGFFGGRVLPDWRLGRPGWLIDEDLAHLSGLIVKFDLGPECRRLAEADPLPFGASFGLRRGTAVSFHLVDPRRLRLGYLYRFGVEKGIAASRMRQTPDGSGGSVASALGFLFKGMVQLLKGRGDRFRQCVINSGIQMGLRRERSGGAV